MIYNTIIKVDIAMTLMTIQITFPDNIHGVKVD